MSSPKAFSDQGRAKPRCSSGASMQVAHSVSRCGMSVPPGASRRRRASAIAVKCPPQKGSTPRRSETITSARSASVTSVDRPWMNSMESAQPFAAAISRATPIALAGSIA
jgi:hypothetical protein